MKTAFAKTQQSLPGLIDVEQIQDEAHTASTETAPASLKTRPAAVWLGLHFSNMALISAQAARDSIDMPVDTPLVVVELKNKQTRVYQANNEAKAQGIEEGCMLNAAYVLCHPLEVIKRDPALELAQLHRYTRRVAKFTPKIVVSGSDTLLLEVRHSLHLFGGFKALLAQLKRVFSDVLLHIACAPVPVVAELMARNKIHKLISRHEDLQSALASIPLNQTTVHPGLIQKLQRCGLFCLRDVWRLPRAGLARRFGPDLLHYLDILSGKIESPQCIFDAKPRFNAGYDFDQETEFTSHLLQAAEILLQQAQQFLQIRALLCEEVRFHFVYTHRRGETRQGQPLSVYAQQGGDSAAHFLLQLEESLQRFKFRKAVIRIELTIDQFRLRQDSTQDLFRHTQENTQSWSMLLDILFARLGMKSVYYLLVQADHRPENAWNKCNASQRTGADSQALLHTSTARPIWLLPEPLEKPELAFILTSGPERLESGWWSGEDLRREYYQGISPSGQRCWLFRDLMACKQPWYMHGLFA